LSEDRLLYKLKHGLKLNSREFLTIGSNLEPISSEFTALFNSKERLYIKFSLHHKLEDDSEHFKILGELESIKMSISEKILNYRKKLEAYSYIEGVMDEIAIKLIYTEPLSVKEVGKVVNLSEKQVYKKIAKIKEKLKEMVT
jgi:DNA-directed RNA polymerase specialized sigma subunit